MKIMIFFLETFPQLILRIIYNSSVQHKVLSRQLSGIKEVTSKVLDVSVINLYISLQTTFSRGVLYDSVAKHED